MESNSLDPNDQMPTDYQMPDGKWLSFWVASDYRLSDWSYFWVSFPSRRMPATWYRVYKVETPPPEWKPMKPKKKVYEQTGFDDEGDEGDDKHQLSAAQKLRMGKYRFEVKIQIDEQDYEIGGITFKVFGEPIRGGWG